MSLSLGTRLGPYEITTPIGKGGMGEVYRAEDTRLGRAVAIKVLPTSFASDPARLKRFELEARSVSALNHSNILTVHDVGTHEGSPYLVMELLDGETLRETLAAGALPAKQALAIALQMAHGLAAAHARGLVHRDLKPANLFISPDGHLKILDFGLARHAVAPLSDQSQLPTQDASDLTAEGLTLGTPGYMSPEQATGQPVDARSDLFAFGVVLYEMLSGHSPFQRNSAIETLSATLKEEPPDLVSPVNPLSPSLKRLVTHCLEKEPAHRFQSAQDLIDELETVLADSPTAAGPRERMRLRFGHHPTVRTLLIAGLILLAAGGGALLLKAWRRPEILPPNTLPSLVALPTKVLGNQESAFLTDAIPDALSTLLGGVEGLDLKVPPSSSEFEKVKGDLAKIAEFYHVDLLLLTTITAQGESLTFNIKIAEATTQKVRWAGQFEGTRATYNALIREATRSLLRVLKPGMAGSVLDPGLSANSEVELALREGQHYQDRFSSFHQPQDFERSRAAYERALKLDPSSAPVLGSFANLWVLQWWWGPGASDASAREAERLAQRALSLDAQNGGAWAALAQLELAKRPVSLEKLLDYAIKAANPHSRQSDHGAMLGGVAGGAILMAAGGQRAFARNPMALLDAGMGATGLNWQGRPNEALQLLDKALAVEPRFPFGLVAKAEALVGLGRLSEAEALLKRCEPKDTDRSWDAELWRQVQFKLAVATKDRATATRLADRAAKLWLGPRSTELDFNAAWTMPQGFMKLGRREDALRMLELAMARLPNAEGYLWTLNDPDLSPLRGSPRFERLREQGKASLALALRMLEGARDRGDLPPAFNETLAELRDLQNRTP